MIIIRKIKVKTVPVEVEKVSLPLWVKETGIPKMSNCLSVFHSCFFHWAAWTLKRNVRSESPLPGKGFEDGGTYASQAFSPAPSYARCTEVGLR